MPTELKKIGPFYQGHCNEEYFISLALKCWLTDKSVVNKKQIGSALVNTALQKLTKIIPFYSNITLDTEWQDFSKQSDIALWKLLSDKNNDSNARESNKSDQTDSHDIKGNNKFKERELKESSSPFPTTM